MVESVEVKVGDCGGDEPARGRTFAVHDDGERGFLGLELANVFAEYDNRRL
jgi:hypothetical protein